MLSHGYLMLDPDMNDRKSTSPEDSGQLPGVGAPVSLSRRRFARGAAPVLLGTLVSKPVLGAEYICTVSGHASGNASAHLTDDAVCDVGRGINYWRNNAWPDGFTKGGLPVANTTTNTCDFAVGIGTLFNGLTLGGQTLSNTFFYSNATNGCVVNQNSIRPAASLHQVLARVGGDEKYELGRVTVASLLNAAQFGNYPVSQARIIEMFNAVKDDGIYHVEGANLDLTRTGVIEYLKKLYN